MNIGLTRSFARGISLSSNVTKGIKTAERVARSTRSIQKGSQALKAAKILSDGNKIVKSADVLKKATIIAKKGTVSALTAKDLEKFVSAEKARRTATLVNCTESLNRMSNIAKTATDVTKAAEKAERIERTLDVAQKAIATTNMALETCALVKGLTEEPEVPEFQAFPEEESMFGYDDSVVKDEEEMEELENSSQGENADSYSMEDKLNSIMACLACDSISTETKQALISELMAIA